MKRELEDKLAEEFDFMRRKPVPVDGSIDNLYDAFGIDTGDGWYQLLYDMCKEIAEVLETAEKPVHIVVDQIKEKYGTLRFYYHFEGEEPGIQAFDFIGLGSMRIMPERDDVNQKISEIVQKYEDKSGEVCETCGCEGTERTDLRWIQTLCDTCYLKALKELRKREKNYE